MYMTPTEEQSSGVLQTAPTHTGIDWNELITHEHKSGLAAEVLASRPNPLTILDPENYHKVRLWDSITIPGRCMSHPESMT